MAEELQSLLNKINQDGIKKAEGERAKIVAEAEAKAHEIIARAKQEAAAIEKNAAVEAENLKKRAESAIQQASRDVLLALKSELERRMNVVLTANINEALTPELMASIVKELSTAFAQNADAQVTVLASAKDAVSLADAVKKSLAESFKQQPQIFPDKELKGGFKVNFSGSDVYYDFSDTAIRELVADYIGPKLAKLLKN